MKIYVILWYLQQLARSKPEASTTDFPSAGYLPSKMCNNHRNPLALAQQPHQAQSPDTPLLVCQVNVQPFRVVAQGPNTAMSGGMNKR